MSRQKGGTRPRWCSTPGSRPASASWSRPTSSSRSRIRTASTCDWKPSGWESAYDAGRFWHLIINTGPADLAHAIALAKGRNIGWVYATPDVEPNPWDTLPDHSYWSQQLQLAKG